MDDLKFEIEFSLSKKEYIRRWIGVQGIYKHGSCIEDYMT